MRHFIIDNLLDKCYRQPSSIAIRRHAFHNVCARRDLMIDQNRLSVVIAANGCDFVARDHYGSYVTLLPVFYPEEGEC